MVLAVALLVIAVLATRSEGPAAVAPVPTPSPTPTPGPDFWRLDGFVRDEQGKPIEGVCVGLGPAICTDVNPRTDAKGYWFIDLPKAAVDYDFHFTKPGYLEYDQTIRPVATQTFTTQLRR